MMTLWERILQGMTAFSLETVVSLVAGVLGARLVFHYLPAADYGQLALFLSFYVVGTIFLSLGLGPVFGAEIARARGAGDRSWTKFLIRCYLVLLVSTATILLVVFAVVGTWQREPLLWSIMGAYLWLTAPNTVARTVLHGATRYRRLAGQSITRSLARLALLATLPWWWSGNRLIGVALTYPLMELAALLVSLHLAHTVWSELRVTPTKTYAYRSLMSLFRQQGVYATLSVPVKKIIDQMPIWFLRAAVTNAEVGAFAAAQRAYNLIFVFFRSLETTLFPLVSEQAKTHPDRLRVALRQAQKYSFWLGLFVAAAGSVGASWIVLWIAGPEYEMVVPLFRLLLWHLLIYAFAQSQRPIFYAIGKQKWLFLTYLFAGAVESALLLVGVRLLGASGAIWSILLRSAVAVSIKYALILRLAPGLWIDPRGVMRVEEFDRRLCKSLKELIQRLLTRHLK